MEGKRQEPPTKHHKGTTNEQKHETRRNHTQIKRREKTSKTGRSTEHRPRHVLVKTRGKKRSIRRNRKRAEPKRAIEATEAAEAGQGKEKAYDAM